MIATTFYLDLSLLHRTYDLWQASCESVKSFDGIAWAMTFHPIFQAVISKSPFLQSAIPNRSANQDSIIIAQLFGTWRDPKDTTEVEKTALKLISEIEDAAREQNKQTGYLYLNYAYPGQDVFGDGSADGGEKKKFLQDVSRRYDPDGIFQRCVPGGFKLF